jgi:cytochrome c oxidase subunit 1
MFTSGLTDQAALAFSLLTFLVAVPSAIKVFNWIATLYKGSIELSAALLYTLGFIFLFGIGGLTGLMQGALAVNVQVHDTYFIVGHFHYVIFGGTGFAFFGALHYWFPKMFGRMVDERRAKLAWIPIFVGFNLFYFSMLVIGFQGMPRRYFDHLPQFHTGHQLASAGAFLMVAGVLTMFHNLGKALLRGPPAPPNPWGGVTLEWSTPSPPPEENFAIVPTIPAKPYTFPRVVAR